MVLVGLVAAGPVVAAGLVARPARGLPAGLVLRAGPVVAPPTRAFGAAMCDATWEAAPDAGAWEEADMPS